MATQLSRIIKFINPLSMVPLYLSFIPYIFFHLLAQEAHLLLGILWFISLMAIHLQIATQKLSMHVFIATGVFVACYLLLQLIIETARTQSSKTETFFPSQIIFRSYPVYDSFNNPYCSDSKANLTITNTTAICTRVRVVPKVHWGQEGVFVVGCFLLCIALYMLQQFIKAYALNLVDRQVQVTQLAKQNADLKVQLKA
ncbi:hypothetical protein HK098_006887 [Nowakowskiella sp. JEL0407]|nr:hypothetical protein HK098_006887 [Nowakowskiella sp. JEL0407]